MHNQTFDYEDFDLIDSDKSKPKTPRVHTRIDKDTRLYKNKNILGNLDQNKVEIRPRKPIINPRSMYILN